MKKTLWKYIGWLKVLWPNFRRLIWTRKYKQTVVHFTTASGFESLKLSVLNFCITARWGLHNHTMKLILHSFIENWQNSNDKGEMKWHNLLIKGMPISISCTSVVFDGYTRMHWGTLVSEAMQHLLHTSLRMQFGIHHMGSSWGSINFSLSSVNGFYTKV
jgi:hypothetical protein